MTPQLAESLDALAPETEQVLITARRLRELREIERLMQLFRDGLLDAEGLMRALRRAAE